MIEVHLAYDIVPGTSEEAYKDWMKKALVPVLQSKGMVEVRAHRNIMESPQVLVIGVWATLEDWVAFAQSQAWYHLTNTLQTNLATDLRIEVWGPSPVLPESILPPKQG